MKATSTIWPLAAIVAGGLWLHKKAKATSGVGATYGVSGKAKPTTIVLNNQWGYSYAPQTFSSRKEALEYAKEMIRNGYAWAYRII